jgi:hypothetical protein
VDLLVDARAVFLDGRRGPHGAANGKAPLLLVLTLDFPTPAEKVQPETINLIGPQVNDQVGHGRRNCVGV